MKRVLFVCVENAGRSQMAQALARLRGAGRLLAYSAGSRPSGRINPHAIEVLREQGYDLATHRSTGLDDLPEGEFDAIITMGCGDACPWVPARIREDWPLADPKDLNLNGVRELRDEIEKRVVDLIETLDQDDGS